MFMIAIDEEDFTTIYLTRGDRVSNLSFFYPILNGVTGEEENYKFKKGDKISFIVVSKKGYTKDEVLRKEFVLKEATECPVIELTSEDTKAFDLKNKRVTYWYDIVLNDEMTILGYDEDGAKKMIVFPEGGEKIER